MVMKYGTGLNINDYIENQGYYLKYCLLAYFKQKSEILSQVYNN